MKELPNTKYHETVEKSSFDRKEIVDNLKNNINILELIENSGVILKKQGKNYIGKCPFHDDKTPSLTVTPEKNLWNCLGECQQGGSAIDWVMIRDKVGVRKAIEMLKQKFSHFAVKNTNLPVIAQSTEETKPTIASEVNKVSVAPQEKQVLLKKVIAYYQRTLKDNKPALEYLEKRGLNNPELIEHFQLGFSNRTLSKAFINGKSGKKLKDKLIEIGIYRDSGHEHFHGSLVVPIISQDGDITEIYGRKINDKLRSGTLYHLYLKGPHEGIFNPECLKSKEIILCESVIDALSFWVKGYRNVTCSYGVGGFTKEHLELFAKNKVAKVYIAFDNDRAGDSGAAKIAEKLLAQGISSYRVLFKDVKDANEFIQSSDFSKEAMAQLFKDAISLGSQNQATKQSPTIPEQVPGQTPKQTPLESQLKKSIAANIPYEWQNDDILFTFQDRAYRIKKMKKTYLLTTCVSV